MTPTCPACGQPIYGWIKLGGEPGDDGSGWVVDRCENCGLGVTRALGEGPEPSGNGRPPAGLAELPASAHPDDTLERARERMQPGDSVVLRAPNRASVQAGIGGEKWAALDVPRQQLHLTPKALELLLSHHGLRAAGARRPVSGRSIGWMWQTLLNAFTFHTNFARDVIAGRRVPGNARSLVAYTIDAIVSVLAAIPLMVIAAPVEAVAAAVRRGGELVVTVEADPAAVQQGPGATSPPVYHR